MSPLTLNRITILGTGIVALVVFGALCIRHTVPAIEADLTMRAEKELRIRRMGWADVEIDGRDVTLSGIAPDKSAVEAAIEAARVYGVRQVVSQLTTIEEHVARDRPADTGPDPVTIPPDPYQTRLSVSEDGLMLAGSAPDDESRRRVVRAAQDLFGVAAVEARLQVKPGAPSDWEQAAITALEIAQRMVIGEIEMVDTTVRVTGLTASDAAEAAVTTALKSMPTRYTTTSETGSRTGLESVLSTSPELAARLERRSGRADDGAVRRVESVDAVQCESRFREVLGQRRVLFATASAELTSDSQQLMSELADVLRLCPGARLTIAGHTDDQGLTENNLALSQRRAESVMQYLVARGISLSRLSARGYGEEQPIVANLTADDRAINRRIEFVFEAGQ